MVLLIVPLVIVLLILGGLFYLVIIDTKKMEENTSGSPQAGGPQISTEEKRNPAFHLFLYLVSFLSLGFVAAGIISVYFQLINKVIKETQALGEYSSGYFDSGALKFGIASLAVALPIYYAVLYVLHRKLEKNEIQPQSMIRKFITYFALFVFSAMGVGSLIALLYNYLDGELTTKFLLKALVFFIVSAFFFVFYLWEIRRKEFARNKFLTFFIPSILIAASALVIGLVIVDSPQVAREKKIDSEAIDTIISIHSDVNMFYETNKRLPKAEEGELALSKGVEYFPKGQTGYQLCDTFKQPSEGLQNFQDERWNHPAGRYCFELNALSDTPKNIPAP